MPVENLVGDEMIVVRGRAADNCWNTSTNGPDVPYVDAMMADVEGAFCVDTERRFLTGYSSGSFMAHRVACIRGDKIRGVATIAGGQPGSNCTGTVGALLIHDLNDGTVGISASTSTRDAYLTANSCTSTSTAVPDHDPCVAYDGCAAGTPVVWCQTSGQNHSRQDALASQTFAWFLTSLL